LFIPVISGSEHAIRAIEAGEAVLRAVEDRALVAGGVQIGVGVHTGEAFVGTVGADDRLDFTALGDTVNVAARPGTEAGAGGRRRVRGRAASAQPAGRGRFVRRPERAGPAGQVGATAAGRARAADRRREAVQRQLVPVDPRDIDGEAVGADEPRRPAGEGIIE